LVVALAWVNPLTSWADTPDDATASVTVSGKNGLGDFHQAFGPFLTKYKITCWQEAMDRQLTDCDLSGSSVKSNAISVVYVIHNAPIEVVGKIVDDFLHSANVTKAIATVDAVAVELLVKAATSCTTSCPYNAMCRQYPLPRCASKTCQLCGITGMHHDDDHDKDYGKDHDKSKN
jgi:hypothetical protein